MAWKKLSCSHILCTACIQVMMKQRQAEIIEETHELLSLENGGRKFISWRTKYPKVNESDPAEICPFCRPKK
ncbi:Oidioi.mRNA.OKI2018_I69.XSR.g13296.t1.cds [Oikopleura dioica]|uniref:Oidioi.mRNA.OKI2018_I69.XSR.g13296.t1.cds n=1 Tax=Oikopleura dioica TaxID=34765 RepID=A0ABN7SBM6_OIKDI|nr:Oidioi.mRNA.OKI2018_I69.XSR.g13296.t1.cds [Oikopleura dioica]